MKLWRVRINQYGWSVLGRNAAEAVERAEQILRWTVREEVEVQHVQVEALHG